MSAPSPVSAAAPAIRLRGATVVADGHKILDRVDWSVGHGERWVVLGPNGCGKTTLMRVVSLYLHPSSGTVEVLGQQLGHCDVRTLRTRIGVVSQALADLLRPDLSAADVVMTARHAALEPWWHTYTDDDRRRARDLLMRLGVADHAERTFGSLSTGERQRVQLARTLMAGPDVVLLDEPAAGLDIAAREDLVDRLGELAADPTTPTTVLVTHHVEEIPPGFTHALLMRDGRTLAAGPLAQILTADALSACFGLHLALGVDGDEAPFGAARPGRYWARRR